MGSDNFTLLNVATNQTVSLSNSNTNTGWTAGGGIEWAFWNNFTARLEYDYVGLQNYSVTVPTALPAPIGGDVLSTSNRNIQMLTAGSAICSTVSSLGQSLGFAMSDRHNVLRSRRRLRRRATTAMTIWSD